MRNSTNMYPGYAYGLNMQLDSSRATFIHSRTSISISKTKRAIFLQHTGSLLALGSMLLQCNVKSMNSSLTT
ncbi:hypothetical protein L208DRAFT_1520204 [Tricholoma matsutake]|nr:hypothetical protein L208DRAFT_1520204 [Tricholoma matsutake 945]